MRQCLGFICVAPARSSTVGSTDLFPLCGSARGSTRKWFLPTSRLPSSIRLLYDAIVIVLSALASHSDSPHACASLLLMSLCSFDIINAYNESERHRDIKGLMQRRMAWVGKGGKWETPPLP